MSDQALNVMTDRLIGAALEQRGFTVLPYSYQGMLLPSGGKADEAYYLIRDGGMLGYVYRSGRRWHSISQQYPRDPALSLGPPQPTRLLALQQFVAVKQALLE